MKRTKNKNIDFDEKQKRSLTFKILLGCVGVILLVILGYQLVDTFTKDQGPVLEDPTAVFRYGNENIYKGEVYIYAKTTMQKYEAKYGTGIWQQVLPENNGEISVVELTKKEVVDTIVKTKTYCAHAADYNIELSDEEKEAIKADAESFYKGLTDEEISTLELTQDIIYNVMEENVIANKVEESVLIDYNIEISDEQARMTTFYDMYFNCFTLDSNGNIIPFDEEEKKKQYENAVSASGTLATSEISDQKDKFSIQKLAEYYNLTEAEEKTLSPSQIKQIYGEEIYDLLYSMENGQYSIVVESEYGYHIFEMIALTDPKATMQRKQELTEKNTDELLETRLNVWKEAIDNTFSYPESVNMEVYDTITLD